MKELVLYPIEGNYHKDQIDVSIIVPLYNSSDVIKDQIDKWHQEKHLDIEIIYVDDKCPQRSGWTVFNQWSTREDRSQYKVKVVFSNVRSGFGKACNLGAFHATGKHLIFLNADTLVTPGWISPLIDPLTDNSIGMVGNLHLKEGGEWHGTIDSAGSEWSWEFSNFVHIGRHIHNGKVLSKPFNLEECPEEILKFGDREMVTGCCFSMRKDLFDYLGGFNPSYRLAYWEDSDLCMTVREHGYRIVFQPNSVIRHKLHHSNSSGHNFHDTNKDCFINKWVNSGRLDNIVRSKRNLPLEKVSNILVKRQAARGDVLVASYVLPAIKKKYPESEIYFLTSKECEDVLYGNPHIDHIIHYITDHKFQLIYNFDLIYESRPKVNILQAYAEEAGFNVEDCKPFIDCAPVLGLPEKYVVFHTGKTAWAGRNWSTDKFFAVAEFFKKHGYDIITVGGKGDSLIPKSIDYRNQTTPQTLATIIKNSKMFIGIDSFPMHVAQAVDSDGVCFFGCIDPDTRIISKKMKYVKANGLDCLGCHHKKLPPSTVTDVCIAGHLLCETMVDADQMIRKVKSIWDQNA